MTELILARINDLIDQYGIQHTDINNQQKTFLTSIQNRIRAIFVTQKGWLKFGVMDNAVRLNQPLTQTALIDEANDVQEKTIGFTWIAVKQLQRDIAQAKNADHPTHYHQLLFEIEQSCHAIINNLSKWVRVKENPTLPHDAIDSIKNTDGTAFFLDNAKLVKIIQALDGREFPFRQCDDPLNQTDGNGHCYGYVEDWCKKISLNGFVSHLPRLNSFVYSSQKSRGHGKSFTFPVSAKYYYSTTDFRQLVKELLTSMQSDKIYGLSFPFRANKKHRIGMRFIPSTHEYEVFDPNMGIAVFNNQENFIAFIAWCLVNKYFGLLTARQPIACSIYLYEIGTQPLNARSSIPPVTSNPTLLDSEQKKLLSTMCFSLKDGAKNKNIIISDTTLLRDDIIVAAVLGLSLGYCLQDYIVNAGWHDNTYSSMQISILCQLLGAMIFGMSAIRSPLKLALLIESFLDSIPTTNKIMDQCKLNELSFFSRPKVNTPDINKQDPKTLKIRS